MPPKAAVAEFIDYWSKAKASERANAQAFLISLTELLGVQTPSNDHETGYSFEFPVAIPVGIDFSDGRIDLYRRGCFVLEAKQFVDPQAPPTPLAKVGKELAAYPTKKKAAPIRGTQRWDDAMAKARGQAERYARALPAGEPPPPFLLVVDVGHSFEVFADFTQAGKSYLHFPDPRSFRARLADLEDEAVLERLRAIWRDPLSLDPARRSAEITRDVAGYLAILASSLEDADHPPRLVAEFLTRCLFCMFAEDVGLLPKDGFRQLLESLRGSPEGFVPKLRTLFKEMQTGTDFSVILNRRLLRFNGGLFEESSVLPVDDTQLGILIKAAGMQWKDVEPAIFGTLLERALDPDERHQLGAHYTPRAYVERLVLPTVVEPLRCQWDDVRAAAVVHAQAGRLQEARAEIKRFHDKLCSVTILDPACGSGNFLYVTLEHMKRLEGEVLDTAAGFGENLLLDLATHSVDPHQFLGIELNPRAASITELVLWIGYLQWHFRTRGETMPAEPVLKKFHNIECRDAVLAWDGDPIPEHDERGQAITVWDRQSTKSNPVTGRDVPNESGRVSLLTYPNARPAVWPKADYVIGNPPFLGTKRMRDSLGDGYVETLRRVYSDSVEDNADFVMYWWHKAAVLISDGAIKRFGLITTNSLRQTFNRRVIQEHLQKVSLDFVIPDHPWVDTVDGAAVRIAMTVVALGALPGRLRTVSAEESLDDGSSRVSFVERTGRISADLTIGADVASTGALRGNDKICGLGVALHGSGFILDHSEAEGIRKAGPDVIKPYVGGSDLVRERRERYLIDFSFMSEVEARRANPRAFQHVIDHVRPERVTNRRDAIRKLWWRFGWERPEIRKALVGLSRFIVTTETAKHRVFQFLDASILPDHMVIIVASDDGYLLGVLSSRVHVVFSLAAGGRLGVGNDPRYNKTRCFDPFPFPACDEKAKRCIRACGEDLDTHRKDVQAQHPSVTLTAMYNVMEALRRGRALTPKEQATHDAGLVSVLRQLHDKLDAAVADAYGWPVDLSDAEILNRLVALNAERAAEEAGGQVRWLRPEYQNPTGAPAAVQSGLTLPKSESVKASQRKTKIAWPKSLAERVSAVEGALRSSGKGLTVADLVKCFGRANPENVGEILDTLAKLSRIYRDGDTYFV